MAWLTWLIWTDILIGLIVHLAQSSNTDFPQSVCEVYQNDGDYIIGAIFKPYISETCAGDISHQVSFIEAMAFAIEAINNHSLLLPGVKLGYEIRNACDDGEITIWTSMTMTTSFGRYEYKTTCPKQQRTNSGKVVGIIGTGTSATSIIAAKIGRVVAVPIISYYATSDELSDSERFPFFFRTVPPDRHQVEMIVDILRLYNWKYIALFHSLDSYGVYGARQVVKLAEKFDICIAMRVPVALPASDGEIQEIAKKLSEHDKVYVIVSFVVWHGVVAILKALRLLDTPRKFTFIGNDAWDDVALDDFSDVFYGGITFQFRSYLPATFPDTFPQYFGELQHNKNRVSKWYREKLEEMRVTANCTNSCPIPVHWNVQQVINAVYALAYALNTTLHDQSDQNGPRSAASVDGWLLRQKLLEVSIPCTDGQRFRFDDNGEVAGRYKIENWQKKDGHYKPVHVGTWDSHQEPHLNLEEETIEWNTDNQKAPISLCVEDCKPGYIPVPLEKKCCWGCQKCNDYEIVVIDNRSAKCQNCSVTEWPNDNFTSCVPIKPSFLDYSHPAFTQLIVGAGAGLCFIFVASIGLCYYSKHPIIKASSRELCSINLIGLASLCVSVILNILRPTPAVCVVMEIMTSTSFCISFTPVLLKVNRIWRIFSTKPGKVVSLKSPRSQCLMSLCIIGIQVLLEIISIVSSPSKPMLLFPLQRKPYLEIYCRFGYGFIAPCTFNILIIVGSCYYAFKARKVPDNFNESKFIGVSVYSTLIVCLAAVPVYITAVSVAQKMCAISVPLLVNTYLTLCCLYFPKIYAIHFKKAGRARSAPSSSPASSQNRLDQVTMTTD